MGVPAQAIHDLRVPIVQRPEYTIRFERVQPGHTIGHIDIHVPWTKEVLKKLQADWLVVKDLQGGPIRAMHTPGDRKHLKFLTLFGFRFVASYTDIHDQVREIYST